MGQVVERGDDGAFRDTRADVDAVKAHGSREGGADRPVVQLTVGALELGFGGGKLRRQFLDTRSGDNLVAEQALCPLQLGLNTHPGGLGLGGVGFLHVAIEFNQPVALRNLLTRAEQQFADAPVGERDNLDGFRRNGGSDRFDCCRHGAPANRLHLDKYRRAFAALLLAGRGIAATVCGVITLPGLISAESGYGQNSYQ